MQCICCSRQYNNLGDYFSHYCCATNCKRMDIFDEPSTKKQKDSLICPSCGYKADVLIDYLSHICKENDDRHMEILLNQEPISTDMTMTRPRRI